MLTCAYFMDKLHAFIDATTGKGARTLEVAPSSADPGGMSASLQSHELFQNTLCSNWNKSQLAPT